MDADQLSFNFGGGSSGRRQPPARQGPQAPDNLYFAVLPNEEAARQIAEATDKLRLRHGLVGRTRPIELLHISLLGIGAFHGLPTEAIEAAKYMGDAVRAAPFKVTFGHALSFKTWDRSTAKPRFPLVLSCGDGADRLSSLRGALASTLGVKESGRGGFTPHVTLMYDWEPIPETDLDEPITWTVREFVLVHSLYGKSRHNHLARWRLRG